MLIARFSIEKVEQGWIVRVGPDVLVRVPTKDEAISDAALRVRAIRRLGGTASVVEEPVAAIELQDAF